MASRPIFFFHSSFPSSLQWIYISFLKILLIYFREGKGERKNERERNISVWLPPMRALLGTWPTTQACALAANRTCDPLAHRPVLNPLSHSSQGWIYIIYKYVFSKKASPSELPIPFFSNLLTSEHLWQKNYHSDTYTDTELMFKYPDSIDFIG